MPADSSVTRYTIRQLAESLDSGAISPLQQFILRKLAEWEDPITHKVSDFSAARIAAAIQEEFKFWGEDIRVYSERTIRRAVEGLETDGWLATQKVQGSQRDYPVLLPGAENYPNGNTAPFRGTSKRGGKRDRDVAVMNAPDFGRDYSYLTTNKTNVLTNSDAQTLAMTNSPDFGRDVSVGGLGGGVDGKSRSNAAQAEGFALAADSSSPPPPTIALTGNGVGGDDSQVEEKINVKVAGAGRGNLGPLNMARKAIGEVTFTAGLGNPSLTEGERRNLAQLIKETEPWVAADGQTFHFDEHHSDWVYDFLDRNPTTVEPWQVVALHFAFWVSIKKDSQQEFKQLRHLFATFFAQRSEIEFAWEEQVRVVQASASGVGSTTEQSNSEAI